MAPRDRRLLVALIVLVSTVSSAPVRAAAEVRWAAYYAAAAALSEYDRFDLLILDSDDHAPLGPLLSRGKTLLGYISLGEIGRHRAYFGAVQREGLLLQESEHWKGSFFVDVRDPRWSRRVLDELVPSILAQGFSGLFLDTLDNPGHLERTDPAKYKGMRSAAAALVKAIRARYPRITIMMNRGYDLLPQVEASLDYELGESVFADYDFERKQYQQVAPALYREQVDLLKAAARRQPKLRILTLDYWNPGDAAGIARIYAEQRRNGFSPYVATVSLDRLIAEPVRGLPPAAAVPPHVDVAVPRTILAFYDSRYEQDTRRLPLHQLVEMPLNHLGLVVRYHDINAPLPPMAQLQDVRGILTWFRSDAMADPVAFLAWMSAAVDAGKKVVVIGDVAATFDLKKRRTPPSAIQSFWAKLGLRSAGEWTAITYDLKIVHRNPLMVEFERPLGGVLPGFPRMTAIDRRVVSHLVVRKGGDKATDSSLITIGPNGAYIAPGYLQFSRTEDAPRRQWYVNPFELFREAYGTDDLPKPDTSTMSGRRIFYSHVDGDGWRNETEIAKYRAQKRLSADVVFEEVLKAFPDIPVTVAPVVGDLDPNWFGTRESQRVAKAILALPNVEAGSHTYGHPLDWAAAAQVAEQPAGVVASVTRVIDRLFDRGARSKAAVDVSDRRVDAALGEHRRARTYDVRPFSVDLEIREARDYINGLLPPGKRVQIVQWSGNTSPSANVLAASRAAGLRNLNGGDTRFDPEFNSYGWVAPLARQVGAEHQVYSSNSNENTYTDLWTDRFFGFKYLERTLRNTESPRRIKPHNVYFHMYSGEKLPSLAAVVEHYRYARSQELTPITASHYAGIVDGFFSTRIVLVGDRQWRVERRDALQTIRFDGSAHLSVDFARSTGVIGQRVYQGSLYASLDASVPTPVVALTDAAAEGPYLSHARWLVSDVRVSGSAFAFNTQGFGLGESVWRVAPNNTYAVRVTAAEQTSASRVRSDDQGMLTLNVGEGRGSRGIVRVSAEVDRQ